MLTIKALRLCCAAGLGLVLRAQTPDGESLYRKHCAACHEVSGVTRAPSRAALHSTSPELILDSLEAGLMKAQGKLLPAAERRVLAEYLSGQKLGERIAMAGACEGTPPPFRMEAGDWIGWGGDPSNLRFQKQPGFTAAEAARLKLRWAFGFPSAFAASAQPAVAGGRVFIANTNRHVYSLDAKTGCYWWDFETTTGVRTGISIVAVPGTPVRYAAYFADRRTGVYALDAASGHLLWKTIADDHPHAAVTGTPAVYQGRIYVPLVAAEEGAAMNPKYECCRERGGIVALDAATGEQVWKTWTIEEAKPTGNTAVGVNTWGPSGASIWSAPTIDPKRKLLYASTGNNFSTPATRTSDAVLAMALDTGKIVWARQLSESDTFNMSCVVAEKVNCPDPRGPDHDIGSSPNLITLRSGKTILTVGQKSGIAWGLDPDRQGAVLWKRGVGHGGELGGIQWGPASDNENVYVAVSDITFEDPTFKPGKAFKPAPDKGGGLFALQALTGERIWYAAPKPCGTRPSCSPAQSAAVTAMPGAVFSGSVDGFLRAYSSKNGAVLWEYDTARDFPTVNGVKAKGGSLDGAGPAIAGGMLFVNSGYGSWGGLPGNVLLAFGPE